MCVCIDRESLYVSILKCLISPKSLQFVLAGGSGLYKAAVSVIVDRVLQI